MIQNVEAEITAALRAFLSAFEPIVNLHASNFSTKP